MKAVQDVLFETPGKAGAGGGVADAQSESEQDLAQLGEEAEGQDDDAGGEEDSDEDKGEDRLAARRAGDGTEETEEDEDEEEAESDEGELEDIEEEDKEQPTYARPPIKAIKEKYPSFFKDFPQLKAAFFGYSQYAELFADVDSAKEAVDKAQEYDVIENTLVDKGDPAFLVRTLHENNPKALKKVIANLPGVVKSIDNQAFIELSTPIIEELLYHAAAHGSKTGNKNLQLAARHLANFVFANGGEIPDITRKGQSEKAPSEAEKQLDEERAQHAREKWETALDDVTKTITPDLNAILNYKLDGLTSFERKQIIKEAKAEVDRLLTNDKSFQQTMRNLWKKAAETNYSSESKSRLKRAYLDRAKLVAPSVRNRLKQEALSAKKAPSEKASEGESESRIKFKVSNEKKTFPERGGKTPVSGQRRVLDPKKIDWRKTSDKDILDMP